MRATDTIRGGDLRSRATFKKRPDENSGDSTGFVGELNADTNLDTWETRAENVPCRIETDRGNELVEGKRDISKLYETLTMRYSAAAIPDTTDAVLCDGKRYGVTMVSDPTKRKRKLIVGLIEVK